MKTKILLSLLALFLAMPIDSSAQTKRYSGRKHTTSHGGSYRGGKGSSHKGGHYKNTRTNNRYGKHKKY